MIEGRASRTIVSAHTMRRARRWRDDVGSTLGSGGMSQIVEATR
jgi:hypothetical protein